MRPTPRQLKIVLAQINPTVGDLSANSEKIVGSYRQACSLGADLVVFPEGALPGYPPEDLLLRPGFLRALSEHLERIAREIGSVPAIVGTMRAESEHVYNSAAVLESGKIKHFYDKRLLPNYGVFDEQRYFDPGRGDGVFEICGVKMGLSVCEDIWFDEAGHNLSPKYSENPCLRQARLGAKILLNISASPYHAEKLNVRLQVLQKRARQTKLPIVYANLVGGQDELVFDGRSLVLAADGELARLGRSFTEDLLWAEFREDRGRWNAVKEKNLPLLSGADGPKEIFKALVLGTKDYVEKGGFKKVLIGLSGGIDSALTAAIAASALGPERVVGVTMPSRYSSAGTKSDARKLAENLGIEFHEIPIEKPFKAYLGALAPLFKKLPANIAEENLQSRIRGTMLMALSNKFGYLVLTTGNKSEVSTGYCTLYGDTAGGFAVLKDVPKTLVYQLSRHFNAISGSDAIPESTIDRAPSAELKPNQKDQDTLPPYPLLDRMIHDYVEEDRGYPELLAKGYKKDVARKVVGLIDGSEYKRRQSAPGVKITPKAFGRDRRMPITNRFREYD